MRTSLLPGLLLSIACCAQATVALPFVDRAQSPQTEVDSTRNAIREAFVAVNAGDWEAAAAAFEGAIHSSGFTNLPEELRYPTLLTAGLLAEKAGKHELAHGLLVRATQSSQVESTAWHERLSAAYSLSDLSDSALCITTIAMRWPETLDQINSDAIYSVKRAMDEPNHAPEQLALLQALFDAKWRPDEGEPSALWRDLSRLHLAKGAVGQAKTVAARVRSARVALTMRVDKRFDALTQGNPNLLDIDRIAVDELATARADAKAVPGSLRRLVTLQGVLLDARRFDDVIAIADEVIGKSANGAGKSTYSDYDDQYVWVLDQRSRALAGLGRSDEAIAQWNHSARHPEHGDVNVSQVLNLGAYYADLKRPRDALDIVSELGPMSPYGRMQLEMTQLMAAIELDDTRGAATHLAFMRAHRADAIGTWQTALLMSGDLDGAAALLVERLTDEKWRGAALADVQEYAGPETTPMGAERRLRLEAVLARPKVILAIEKVGRRERFNLSTEQI